VVAPPNLLRGPAADAAYLKSYLQTISGPIVLVAHSYGGFVITNAATGNTNVKALVYIDSFMPDEGESLGALAARSGSCIDESALNPVPYDGGVDLYLGWEANPPYPGFAEGFANGVEPEKAAILAAGQRPAAAAQFEEPFRPPGVEDDPVLVAHRDVGPRDSARAAGGDVRPGRRAQHQGQRRPPVAHHTSC
jgi:pimeloyl-ACP methyl ester carboxylesterase